jgi:hypothetical protein
MSRSIVAVLFVLLGAVAETQQLKPNDVSPEMNRLIKAFEGSYATVEHHQPHRRFPNGGTRRGTTVNWSATGGNTMVSEVRSHGPQGDLDYLGVYWWDPAASVYRCSCG